MSVGRLRIVWARGRAGDVLGLFRGRKVVIRGVTVAVRPLASDSGWNSIDSQQDLRDVAARPCCSSACRSVTPSREHDVAEGTTDRERVRRGGERFVGALHVHLLAHPLFHPHAAPAGAAAERRVSVAMQLLVLGAGDRFDDLARALPHVVVTRVVAGVVIRDRSSPSSPSGFSRPSLTSSRGTRCDG